jgi:NhaP-type Na+/H+ or K+/H+ antiporter
MGVTGVLLLTMALSSATIKRLPISTSMIYLAVGVALGPASLDLVRLDVRGDGSWFERLTEGAVIVSLFIAGAKLRLPLRSPAWRAPLRLAGPLMLWTIAGIAAFAHFQGHVFADTRFNIFFPHHILLDSCVVGIDEDAQKIVQRA